VPDSKAKQSRDSSEKEKFAKQSDLIGRRLK
jgi:hypothetical protein